MTQVTRATGNFAISISPTTRRRVMTAIAVAVESREMLREQAPVRPVLAKESIRLPVGSHASVRSVRPDDLELIQSYVRGLSPASRYFRFLGAISELSATELHRATNPSTSSGSMVLESHHGGTHTMVGEARWHLAAHGQTCELAASIADAWRRQGFGTWLLNHIAARVRSMGARYLLAEILHANQPAQRLVRKLGFHALPSNFDPKVICFVKELPSLATDAEATTRLIA
jgi:GNAT superfamily N-acetyltransferase